MAQLMRRLEPDWTPAPAFTEGSANVFCKLIRVTFHHQNHYDHNSCQKKVFLATPPAPLVAKFHAGPGSPQPSPLFALILKK